jgi:pimeloyl-ACP methyl ester carboxylesterase
MKGMNRIVLAILIVLTGYSAKTQNDYLVSSEFLNNTPSFLLGIVPDIPATYDVDYYKLTYNTVDVDGNETVASGSVAIPVNTECMSVPLAVYCHGTVLRQNDVPSADNAEGFLTKVMASTGYIVIAPDYLGLGENPGIHPYVHAESQATATIDLIRAAREFLETASISDNGETLITGYSQGGHAAMATLEYAEDEDINDELGIKAGAPCSGPYNISDTQANVILSGGPYSNPGYIIYVLMSYQLVYGNLYENLSDVIQQPYADDVAPYFDGMQDEFDMGEVNAILPNTIEELMVDTVLENFENNINHPLWVALRDNDNYDWTPQVPLRMYYCTGDEQVAFENSIVAEETMLQNGAEDVASVNSMPGASHGGCVFPALTDAFQFFTSVSAPCSVLSTVAEKPLDLDVFPNPTDGLVNVSVDETSGQLAVQDMSGKLVYQSVLNSNQTAVDLGKLPSGVYLISLKTEKAVYRNRIVVR